MKKFLILFLLLTIPLLASANLININTASQSELEELNGIGPSKAAAIIEYRETNGSFETIEEIMEVSGIGQTTFNNIKDFITVGTAQDNTNDDNSNTDDDTNSSNSGEVLGDSTTSSSSGGGSNHESYIIESNAPGVFELYASPGRARTGYVGVPLEFVGWVSESKDGKTIRNAKYEWSFGDGSYGDGIYERHTYRNPGDYVVVLRGYYDGKEAISRASVKVLPINIEVAVTPGDDGSITITNDSLSEVNLGDVSIIQGYNKYTAPRDTIILPKSKILLYSDTLWFVPEDVYTKVVTPSGQIVATWGSPLPKSEISREQILSMSQDLDKLQIEARRLMPASTHLTTEDISQVLEPKVLGVDVKAESPKNEIVIEKKVSLFKRIWSKLFK